MIYIFLGIILAAAAIILLSLAYVGWQREKQ